MLNIPLYKREMKGSLKMLILLDVYKRQPTNSGNGTLDYSGTAQITGGIFAASGSSGMAQNFDSSSTQGVIMVNVEEQETNTEIALLDISGTELLSWTAEKEYSSVIVSSPEIQQGETTGKYTA